MTLESVLGRVGSVLLDHSDPGTGERRHLLFSDPVELLIAHHVDDVPDVLEALDKYVAAGRLAAGYAAYEGAAAWTDTAGESLPNRGDDQPMAWFGIYDAVAEPAPHVVDALFNALKEEDSDRHRSLPRSDLPRSDLRRPDLPGPDLPRPEMTIADDDYTAGVDSVRELIREGDVYQVNYTARFEADIVGDSLGLYARLRDRQPVAYGAYIEAGDHQILSLSPELFFRRTGRLIETRPMKGTAPRGRTPEEDAALATWLRTDPKSRAENLMIVDLLRNDLSVVCETGSVEVPELYRVESYPTLFQMISRVTGRVRAGIGTAELFRALFPCGSVTGAPKLRAMRRIRELEPEPRGVYCGAIGFISPEEAVFNVAIRTATTRGGRLRLGAGSGIVWDSDAGEELAEARLKTAFFSDRRNDQARDASGFSLIETMLLDEGRIASLDAHLDRMETSARFFGWVLDRASIARTVRSEVSALRNGRHRIRLLAGPEGVRSVVVRELEPEESPDELRIGIARTEVHSDNPFLRHKTTRRDVYDRARREAEERGLDEVILVNERGEITEGTITNVFLRKGGDWFTPPPSAGLLCGIARAAFKEAVGALERPLTPSDVRTAEEIVLTNAVRGARRAVLDG